MFEDTREQPIEAPAFTSDSYLSERAAKILTSLKGARLAPETLPNLLTELKGFRVPSVY